MKRLLVVLMMCIVVTAAQAIYVENYSFEDPGTGDIKTDWTQIPGWDSDVPNPVDSGVASDWTGSTDGVYSGFLMTEDASVYNLTDHVITAGEVFRLRVDLQENWSPDDITESLMQVSLYYDDAGVRVAAATATVATIWGWPTFELIFAADDVAASIGHPIGIELNNISTFPYENGNNWQGMDNVRLDLIPEPATMALLGIGTLGLLRRKK